MHLDLLMDLKDFYLKKNNNKVTTGPNFHKLAWMVYIVILMNLTDMNAESEP